MTTIVVVVESNAIARMKESGQVVVNFQRLPEEERYRKMEMVLDTFRAYGWTIEDRRTRKEEKEEKT